MQRNIVGLMLIVGLLAISTGVGSLLAQDMAEVDCSAETLTNQQALFADLLAPDFAADKDRALGNLFRLGAAYQTLALDCGYIPNDAELTIMTQQVAEFVDVATLLLAKSAGNDVDTILADLETVTGDAFNGQLLYNGVEMALDGSSLGCVGCHDGQTAPVTEGTWTRIDEIRLQDPALEGYTVRRYLVESIVLPNAYIVPDYLEGLMPDSFGLRMDLQNLADIIAYLESQDQLLDE